METNKIQTKYGVLEYYQDWKEWEGGIRMLNPQTINRYTELKSQHPDALEYDMFFAFNNEQFAEGYAKLIERGSIKEGDKVCSYGAGMYGKSGSYQKMSEFYEDRNKKIAEECDPQEAYFYEFNNYESSINYEGDTEAIKRIIDIWGADVASKIKRYREFISVKDLTRKPVYVEGLYVDNETKRTPYRIYFSDIPETFGEAKCMFNSCLYTVCLPDGTPYINKELAGLSAKYDGKQISNFYHE